VMELAHGHNRYTLGDSPHGDHRRRDVFCYNEIYLMRKFVIIISIILLTAFDLISKVFFEQLLYLG
jgi:hypothetical protein